MDTANWTSDGEVLHANRDGVHIRWEDQQFFTITYKGEKFRGEVMSNRMEEGLLTLKLNHRVFEVKKGGPLDELIASLGMDKPKLRKLKQLKAPMPGRVVSVAVTVGQSIEVGDPLLTLEAMKMETEIRAVADGVVVQVHITAGDAVNTGDVLLSFA